MFIAYFEPRDHTHEVAVHLIDDFVRRGRNAATISPVTAMELLVRPLRVAPRDAAHVYDFVTSTPNLTLLPIDFHVAQEAASLRAAYNFKTPDALIIATGIVGEVAHLVTNDEQWQKKLLSIERRVEVAELKNFV